MGINKKEILAAALASVLATEPVLAKDQVEKTSQEVEKILHSVNVHIGLNHQQNQTAPAMGVSVGKGNVAVNAGGTAGKEYNNGFVAGGVAGDTVYGMGSISTSRGKYGVRGYGASAEVGVVPKGSVVHHAEGHVIHHVARDKQIGENVFFEGGQKTTVGGSVGLNTTVNGLTRVGADYTKGTFGNNKTIGWVSHTEYLPGYGARVGVSGATNGEISLTALKDFSSRVTGFVNAGTNVKHHGGNFVMAGVRVRLDGENPSVGYKPVNAHDVMHDRVINLHAGSREVVQDPVALGREMQKGSSAEEIRKRLEEAMQKELEEVVKQIPGDRIIAADIDDI